jgi:hypothetical protein
LSNGVEYRVVVVATNARGDSEASLLSDGVTPIGSPGAATTVAAVAGDRRAVVSFTPPTSGGGAVLSRFDVVADPGGARASGLLSPIAVDALENGVAYTFTVISVNSGGGESSSAARWVVL